ncbi:hypothetical protein [Labedaea rhizosphaerae]|uniref:Uncharacterized protein n=1 Tax=Labedaea rhizosphaerae TaxID=598644 RepID=A0A4R6S751_LABRH|nr:hypothetical protein [Labedaea rhizosphaerae]TDP95174.1 hypothetical protein EV186_105406 [Labedaea rhizosphaerae]
MPRRSRLRKLATVAVGLAVGAAAALVGTGTASAAPITLTYDVTGVTHIKKTDSDITLGPGALKSTLNAPDPTLTSELTLPTAHSKFNALGFLPTSADIDFLPDGPAIGTVSATQVTATAQVTIRVHNVWSGGLPVIVGSNCKTEVPATISLVSQPGFNVLIGGDLTGTYTMPELDNCLLVTGLLNALIAGPDNTINLHLAIHK